MRLTVLGKLQINTVIYRSSSWKTLAQLRKKCLWYYTLHKHTTQHIWLHRFHFKILLPAVWASLLWTATMAVGSEQLPVLIKVTSSVLC